MKSRLTETSWKNNIWLRRALTAVVLLVIVYYIVPTASDNPRSHTFASKVRDGGRPLVMIHGLGSAPDSMFEMQERLEADGLYLNGKDLIKDTRMCDYGREKGVPTSFSISYYPTESGRAIDHLSSALSRTIQQGGQEDLRKYRDTLRERINNVLACTGASSVDVLAFSMGGNVLKSVLADDPSGIGSIVYLGTPQKPGLYGNKTVDVGLGLEVQLGDVKSAFEDCRRSSGRNIIYSTILSRDLGADCQVLEYALILKGVDANATGGDVTTIAGVIDDTGDGLVRRDSVFVEGADNREVPCEHNTLRSPRKCPSAYVHVKDALASGEERPKTGLEPLWDLVLRMKLALRTSITGS